MARHLIDLASRAKLAVACRAAGDFLADAFDLLANSLDFLFGCLPAERGHPIPSLGSPIKQELFPLDSDNPSPLSSRLTGQET
jgi:hypothetical protein